MTHPHRRYWILYFKTIGRGRFNRTQWRNFKFMTDVEGGAKWDVPGSFERYAVVHSRFATFCGRYAVFSVSSSPLSGPWLPYSWPLAVTFFPVSLTPPQEIVNPPQKTVYLSENWKSALHLEKTEIQTQGEDSLVPSYHGGLFIFLRLKVTK